MEWMLDIQLGRRNLSPIQRIAVAEKYRPLYEKEAKENQRQVKNMEMVEQSLRQIYHKLYTKKKKSVIQVRIKN